MSKKDGFQKPILLFGLLFILIIASHPNNVRVTRGQRITINSEGKNDPEGNIKTYVSGKCGQDYRLVTPVNADIWEINVTIISELSTQPVHIRIYEVIGEYPYNYEEQTNVPYAKGTGRASLVTKLNTSKTYEIWIRDAYAKQFTGIIEENWHPYVINGGFEEGPGFPILGWGSSGHIGHGSGEDTYQQSRSVGLQQAPYPSRIWQDVDIDRYDLVFSFWYKPKPEGTRYKAPEGTPVRFQVMIDNFIVLNETYVGKNDDFEYRHAILFLEPFLKYNNLELGTHRIMFNVPPSDLEYATISIDEVSIKRIKEMEKINTELWCELSQNRINSGETVNISGNIKPSSSEIMILYANFTIQLSYSTDEGKNWWPIANISSDTNGAFQFSWTPPRPGEYIIRATFPENEYFSMSEAWTELLTVGSIVNIDQVNISDNRCDVNSSQIISIHASFAHDNSNAEAILLTINGTEYLTDDSGWISFVVTGKDIGKTIWEIESVSNCDDYKILIESPKIIWDRVQIVLPETQRIDIGQHLIKWNGRYLYNDEVFQGSLILNDTLAKTRIGKYGYRIMGISDPKYGLTSFSANDFQIIFDRVSLQLSISDERIDVGAEPEIMVFGVYEYDSQPFLGHVSLNHPSSVDEVGEFTYSVQSVTDPLYGLTAFTSNDVTCIWDRVKIVDGGVSSETAKPGEAVTVWFKAEYEYDSEVFDGSKGVLYVNGEPMEWSSTNSRWEKEYASDEPKTITLEITGVQDHKYGLTTYNDSVGPIILEWRRTFWQEPIGIVSIGGVTTVLALFLILVMKKRI